MRRYTTPELPGVFTFEDLRRLGKFLNKELLFSAIPVSVKESRELLEDIRECQDWSCSACMTCKNRHYEAARITADPYYSSPEEEWCEEDSDNFGSEDGCKYYEEIKEVDLLPENDLGYEVGGEC